MTIKTDNTYTGQRPVSCSSLRGRVLVFSSSAKQKVLSKTVRLVLVYPVFWESKLYLRYYKYSPPLTHTPSFPEKT